MSRPRESYRPLLKPTEATTGKIASSTSEKYSVAAEAGTKIRIGRGSDELQKWNMKTGIVTQATGSGYVESGKCKVLCGVYGPRASTKGVVDFSAKGTLQVDVKFAPFAGENHRGKFRGQDEEQLSKELKTSLEAAIRLEKYPKSVIDIYIVIIQEGGAIIPTAVTAASLALGDSGIELCDLVSGCSSGLVNNEILLDLNLSEKRTATSIMSVAMMPSLQNVTHLSQSGQMLPSESINALEQCIDGCASVHTQMVTCLVKSAEARVLMQKSQKEIDIAK